VVLITDGFLLCSECSERERERERERQIDKQTEIGKGEERSREADKQIYQANITFACNLSLLVIVRTSTGKGNACCVAMIKEEADKVT